MAIPKVVAVNTINDHKLEILFDNQQLKQYDLKPLLNHPVFAPLKNETLFKTVKVDTGGYGITWNENIDLSEYELWTNSKTIDAHNQQVEVIHL